MAANSVRSLPKRDQEEGARTPKFDGARAPLMEISLNASSPIKDSKAMRRNHSDLARSQIAGSWEEELEDNSGAPVKLSAVDVGKNEPEKPSHVENGPFKVVGDEQRLKGLLSQIQDKNEFSACGRESEIIRCKSESFAEILGKECEEIRRKSNSLAETENSMVSLAKRPRRPISSCKVPLRKIDVNGPGIQLAAADNWNANFRNFFGGCRENAHQGGSSSFDFRDSVDSSSSSNRTISSLKTKKSLGLSEMWPQLLVYNSAFSDNEIFDPYSMAVNIGRHGSPYIILAASNGWALIADNEDEDPYFFDPLYGHAVQLPQPEGGLPPYCFAGTFISSPLQIVLAWSKPGNRISIWAYFDGNDSWYSIEFDEVKEGVFSMVTHDGRVWWVCLNGGIYMA